MYSNVKKAREMRYRGFEHSHIPGEIKDVFDSHIYRHLLGKKVIIDDKEASHEYFSSPRDIALGLSTDGFAPFKRRKALLGPLSFSIIIFRRKHDSKRATTLVLVLFQDIKSLWT
jgi:hypothetical protein